MDTNPLDPLDPLVPLAERTALVIVPDLFFSTKIAEVARHVGVTVRLAPRLADIPAAYAACGAAAPRVAFIDIASLGVDTAAAIDALRAVSGASLRIIAFGSHVDTAAFNAADAAGADLSLPRSKFVAMLPQLLRGEV